MIRKKSSGMLLAIGILGMILLSGCGAGTSGDVPAPPPGQTVAASVDLLVSNPQLNSDVTGAPTVTLTAIVKDGSNRAMSGKGVSFTADSGLLAVTSGTTDEGGKATATLSTGGDPTNRLIRLSAGSDAVSTTNTVTVTGTNLSISGAASLSFGDTTPLTIFLKDSAGAGIPGRTVTMTSQKGNTLSPASAVTNASGQVIVNVTAKAGGADKIAASAIGASKEFDLLVNTAILTFIDPPPAVITEIPIETNRSVSVQYVSGTTPQVGVTVNFFTTRGTLSSTSAITGADGRAAITVSSANSGPALLLATVAAGPTSQAAVEFIAPTVNKLDLKASPAKIGTNSGASETEQSLITATVRDANNNLVKNKTVSFTIVNDVSGGRLTPASAITDSFGTASTVFIAGASPGGLGGVTIRSLVLGTTVTATTTLTVGGKALFITMSTGPVINKLEPNKYQKDYVALVTDSAGNPVVGATVVATVTPVYYKKGSYFFPTGGQRWLQALTLQPLSSTLPGIPACANEDGMLHNPLYDFNGNLDTNPLTGEKEDQNGNSRLDPGNVASVTPAVTDATGHATVSIVYARDYAYWVNVTLEAFANDLKGSTASAFAIFDLEGAAADFTDPNVRPPGFISPFGTSASCFVDLTVTPVSSSQMSLAWQKSATASAYRIYRNGFLITPTAQNTYFDSGLSPGTQYCYQIRTVEAGVEKEFTGTVCRTTNVLAPSGLTATAISPSQIRLSWSALTGVTGYRVYRNGELGVLTLLKSVVSTTTVDSGLTANTLYCYAVTGNDAAGTESPRSAQVCATTQLSAPATPLGLAATGAENPPAITLTWNGTAGAFLYRIYRDGGTQLLGGPNLSVSAPAVTVVDTGLDVNGLEPKTGYCYTISAVDASGNESAQSTAVCSATGGAVPPAPNGITATPLPGPQVRLTWSGSGGAVGYRIYRNGTPTQIASTVTSATDTTVDPNTGYCYAVSALDGSGNESAKSAQVCVVTGATAPAIPTGLTATVPVGALRIVLTWTASAGADSYRVYRDGGTVAIQTVTGVTATDATVSASTTYCYTVSAVNSAGDESAQSVSACAATPAAPPLSPVGLTVSAISPTQIQASWAAVAGATGYRIYRDGVVTPYTSVSTTSFTDTGLTPNTVYCYAVSSMNAAGTESAKSAQLCATTQIAAPATPTGLTAVGGVFTPGPIPPRSFKVDLTWNASPGAAIYVLRRTGGAGPSIASVNAPVVAVTDIGSASAPLLTATTYCYTITAMDLNGNESPQSQQVCTATP